MGFGSIVAPMFGSTDIGISSKSLRLPSAWKVKGYVAICRVMPVCATHFVLRITTSGRCTHASIGPPKGAKRPQGGKYRSGFALG